MDYTFEFRSLKAGSKTSLNAKRHPFLVYKETLHNIVKHPKATRVFVDLGDQGEPLSLEVGDDGVDIPKNGGMHVTAIQKLDERACSLEGEVQVGPDDRFGALLRLVVRRAHLIANPNQS